MRWLLALGLLLTACDSTQTWDVRGVVHGVQREYDQVLIEHDEIPDHMPGMTMNFDVADPALLDGIEKGQVVQFRLVFDGKRYRVTAIQVVGQGVAGSSALTLDAIPSLAMPAPDFTLTDQDGESLSLDDLSGKAVVVSFIFTHCPGPCPILAGILRDAQQLLPEAVRARTHFVSVTLDPARDSPEVLRAYAGHRGIDTTDWSLLTGTKPEVEDVLKRWGVASQVQADGNIDHLVATFLVDPEGSIVERYLGTQHTAEDIVKDLERILS